MGMVWSVEPASTMMCSHWTAVWPRTLSMQSRMNRPWLKLGVTMENFIPALSRDKNLAVLHEPLVAESRDGLVGRSWDDRLQPIFPIQILHDPWGIPVRAS